MTDETHREPLMAWQFLRRYFVWITIGAALTLAIWFALSIFVPYQREQRIGRSIKSHRGYAIFLYTGPKWILRWLQKRVPIYDRINFVDITTPSIPNGLFSELESLSRLEVLGLDGAQVTDADLEHLKGLTQLSNLDLAETSTTDAGLESLQGLTNLEALILSRTQVTDAGLVHLKNMSKLNHLSFECDSNYECRNDAHQKPFQPRLSQYCGYAGERRRA